MWVYFDRKGIGLEYFYSTWEISWKGNIERIHFLIYLTDALSRSVKTMVDYRLYGHHLNVEAIFLLK